jgi:hypothetical protein
MTTDSSPIASPATPSAASPVIQTAAVFFEPAPRPCAFVWATPSTTSLLS